MPSRTYRPLTFFSLFGGLNNPNGPFPTPTGNFGTAGQPLLPSALSFVCPDSRNLFGFGLCRPGSFIADGDPDRFVGWKVGDAPVGVLGAPEDGDSWEDTSNEVLARQFPPGTIVFGPRLRDINPAPDFALVTLATYRTAWYGFHVGCCPTNKGCGPYEFNQGEVVVSGFGEPRIDSRVAFFNESSLPIVPGDAFGTALGEDPDPTVPGLLEARGVEPSFSLACPLLNGYQQIGHVPALGGLMRPPVPAYLPNPNSINVDEAADARNTATKELWAWTDVIEQTASIAYGDPGSRWWQISWGDNSGMTGSAGLRIWPLWIEPFTPPTPPEPGRMDIGDMKNHIRSIRGGRSGHRG